MCKVNSALSVKMIMQLALPWNRDVSKAFGTKYLMFSSKSAGEPLTRRLYVAYFILHMPARRSPMPPSRKKPDAKASALQHQGGLHPNPEQVVDELFTSGNEFFDPFAGLKSRVELDERIGPEQAFCQAFIDLFTDDRIPEVDETPDV